MSKGFLIFIVDFSAVGRAPLLGPENFNTAPIISKYITQTSFPVQVISAV